MADGAKSRSTKSRLWMYEQMVLSRYLEEQLIAAYLEGKQPIFDWAAGPLPGEMHLSYGQESVGAGLGAVLDNTKDWLHAGHRPHHAAIAHGVDLKEMTAEIFGKKTGLSEGRGGHMHIYDKRVKFAASSIIGEQMPAAAGMALACKMKNTGGVAVSVTGDGGANQGAFHETLNFAAVQNLPYIAVIEDNNWAVSVRKDESTAIARNSDRADAYGIEGRYVSGNDPDDIRETCQWAVDRARAGEGPSIVEVETFRFMGHFFPDPAAYISEEEKGGWTDCVKVYRQKLLDEDAASEADIAAVEDKAKADVAAAMTFARESDYLPLDAAYTKVFAEA